MEVTTYQSGDDAVVRGFLAQQFPDSPQKSEERFFRWRFGENPLGSSLPDYLLAWDGGNLVGQMGALRDRMYVDGEWHDCLWLVDLIVDPAHRGSLAALRLFQAAMKRCGLVLAVGAGPNLLPLYRALKWTLQPVAGTYFSIGRLGGLLQLAEAAEGPAPAWKRAVPLTNPAFGLAQLAGCMWRPNSEVHVDAVNEFGAGTDELLQELTPALGISTYRSAAVLQWKFFGRPGGKHFVVAARDARGGLRGYAAVKLMRRGDVVWGEIADLMAHPEEPAVFQSLLRTAVKRCREHHTDFVRFRCSHPAQLALVGPPFWIRRNRHVIDDVLYFTRDRELARALAELPWHLTSVVSDRTDHGRDEWLSG